MRTLLLLPVCAAMFMLLGCGNGRIAICPPHTNIKQIRVYSYPLDAEFPGTPSVEDAKHSTWSYKDTIEDIYQLQEICAAIKDLPYKKSTDQAYISWRGLCEIFFSDGRKENIEIDSEGRIYFNGFVFDSSYYLLNLLGIVCISIK